MRFNLTIFAIFGIAYISLDLWIICNDLSESYLSYHLCGFFFAIAGVLAQAKAEQLREKLNKE